MSVELKMGEPQQFEIIDPVSDARWDELVDRHPAGTAYHHSAWTQMLAATYGHRSAHVGLVAADGGRLEGGVPYLYVSSPLTGKRLVAKPFTAFCNPLLPEALWLAAAEFARRQFPDARHAEMRMVRPVGSPAGAEPPGISTPFVCSIVPLAGSLDDIFSRFHSSCIRRQLRRAEKAGLEFRLATDPGDLRALYELIVKLRQREGLPTPAFKFFANMQRFLEPRGLYFLAVIERNHQILAAACIVKSRNIWHLEYNAAHPKLPLDGANQLLMWQIIQRAHAAGIQFFDFGRTALWHDSLLDYKERWGAARYPIHCWFSPEPASPPTWRDTSKSWVVRLHRKFPAALLKWEGRLLYQHRD